MQTRERKKIQQNFVAKMDYDELMNCTRCGFCLPSCPTYKETNQDEKHSPRGRIAIMKGVVDGLIEPDDEVKRSIDLCLGCRACETACPSGVNFGQLLEQARHAIYEVNNQSATEKVARTQVLNRFFMDQKEMVSAVNLLGIYQRTGIGKFAHSFGLMSMLPDTMATMEKVLPKAPTKRQMQNRPRYYEPIGKKTKKVAFFGGCLMDTLFLKTNESTTKLLQYAGCEIVVPEGQGCCGALHGHSGEVDQSKVLAKRNIEAFEKAGVDYIITNAGGCGAFLVDYGHLLRDEPEWKARAEAFSAKIQDITSILVDLDFHKQKLSLPRQIVTYQDSCHLRNGQKVSEQPRQLLRAIEGVEFVEMVGADSCCGSAGIYNLVESDMSMQILDKKMTHVKATDAKTIVTTNPGCLLQMKLGIEREELSDKMDGVHIVDLLVEAYERANR